MPDESKENVPVTISKEGTKTEVASSTQSVKWNVLLTAFSVEVGLRYGDGVICLC